MSWWERIAAAQGSSATVDGTPGTRRARGRSVYDDRYRSTGPVTVVMTQTGRLLGLERDGHFEPTQPCCPAPRTCERGECWTALEGAREL
jgi:hypothetical protein